MILRLLVASENANKQTDKQDSCFISIDKAKKGTVVLNHTIWAKTRTLSTYSTVALKRDEIQKCKLAWVLRLFFREMTIK